MLGEGPAVKIIIHLNDDESSGRDFLYKEILSFLYQEGVAGASLLKVHSGFGSHHKLHTEGAEWEAGKHLPVRIEFIEKKERVLKLLPRLGKLLTDGLIEMQETTVIRSVHSADSDVLS